MNGGHRVGCVAGGQVQLQSVWFSSFMKGVHTVSTAGTLIQTFLYRMPFPEEPVVDCSLVLLERPWEWVGQTRSQYIWMLIGREDGGDQRGYAVKRQSLPRQEAKHWSAGAAG